MDARATLHRRLLAALWVGALCIAPIILFASAWRAGVGFAAMPLFGSAFQAGALPEVRAAGLPVYTEFGYDGQFYAQLALDPLLTRSGELNAALDTAGYRSWRILVPALAWVAGGGGTLGVLNAYALSNAVAWVALLAILLQRFRPLSLRGAAVITAIVLSQGTLVSVARALTDLPATLLLVAGVLSSGLAARSSWFAAAVLCRETALLSAPGMVRFGEPRELRSWRAWLPPLIAGGALACWLAFVWMRFGGNIGPAGSNFSVPFAGIAGKLEHALGEFVSRPRRTQLFELLAPLSLLVQVAYLATRPRPGCPVWRMAVPWAMLLLLIGPAIWVEQYAFTRVLLPLTVCFNLLLILHPHERPSWLGWFVAGNVGLCNLAMNLYFRN